MLWTIPENNERDGGGGGGGVGGRNAPILHLYIPHNDVFHAETPTMIYPNK